MNALEHLEAKVQAFDAAAERAAWDGHKRMSHLYRTLSKACHNLTWMSWPPPYTASHPKPRRRTTDAATAARWLAAGRERLGEVERLQR